MSKKTKSDKSANWTTAAGTPTKAAAQGARRAPGSRRKR